MAKLTSAIILNLFISLLCASMATSESYQETLLRCLQSHSPASSSPISEVTFFPGNHSYSSVLNSYIRNLRFASPKTPKPIFIVAPTNLSHVRASVLCARIHGLEIRIRSGGHDYDGLSYVSDSPFIIVDMFNLRSVILDMKDETAWVESGATLGEVYFRIAEKSKIHGFPGGVCPTVGVGGHFSGGGYGNMMRKFGLTVDNVVDAVLVDFNGEIFDRKSMGEDLFWAIRGGGGASFGILISWKIKLVSVPETVTVFKIEKTMEEGALDIVHKWQYVASNFDDDLFIRVVVLPANKKGRSTIKAKFVALFLGNAGKLFEIMRQRLPELGLKKEDVTEMSWIESVLFWSNYPNGTSPDVLLDRQPKSEKFLKKKSDYVQEPISKTDLEELWRKMMEMGKIALTLNPYGGKMSEIAESETAFPHRAGNLYKIQYSVTWKEEGRDESEKNLGVIRKIYDFMTPFVSKSPRCSYLNYRDIDLGTNENGESSYLDADFWGRKYFKGNLERLLEVKSMVDPLNFFRYEQSIPPLSSFRPEQNNSNAKFEQL